MKPHGRKWRFEMRFWQPQAYGVRLYNYPLWSWNTGNTGYRKRMKV